MLPVPTISRLPLLFCCLVSTAAQDSVIRVTTRLVQVSAVVHDRQGKPVRNLKIRDFEVTDNGRKQKIGLFRLEQPSAQSESDLPPGEVSNRIGTAETTAGSYSVILFDRLNTQLADQSYAREQVLKFLESVQSQDRIAICRMDGASLTVVHDFTNRRDQLIAAFRHLLPEYQAKLAASRLDPALLKEAAKLSGSAAASDSPSQSGDAADSDPAADASATTDLQAQALRDAAYAESAFYTKDRVINTCTALKALAARLSGFPGRKSIVWVSGGFPISSVFGEADAGNFIRNRMGAKFAELHASRIEDASRALNDANVAVYPVDVVGLRVSAFGNRNIQSMTYLADLTGGQAYYNTNGIEESIRKALDDSAATYTLGYYLNNSDADRTYHNIRVKVLRPGVEVRSKRGYFARAYTPLDAAGAEQLSREALWSPFDSTGIGLRGRLDPVDATPGAVRVTLAVTADDLVFAANDGQYIADVDFFFVPLTSGKTTPPAERQPVHLRFTVDRYRQFLRTDWLVGRQLNLPPETRSVRVLILDRTTGATGSVTLPVTTPR